MKRLITLFIGIGLSFVVYSQESASLPYRAIGEYPPDYSSGNILSRMIDGLGFRYYWATDSLTDENLKYQTTEDARTIYETIDHIYGLSKTIVNAALSQPNIRTEVEEALTYEELRALTLANFKKASELCANKSAEEVSQFAVIFGSGEGARTYAYWHMINGPIADAIYHTGQVTTLRRAAGNPINQNISVFMGRLRD